MVLLAARTPLIAMVDGGDPLSRLQAGHAPEQRMRLFSLNISLEGRYDDNITQLSEQDIGRLKNNRDPTRFLIETPDDMIMEGNLNFRWKAHPIRRRETAIRASLDAHRYSRNDVKNYEKFGVSISQEVTASRRHLGSLRLEFSRIPHFYLRQITDDDASFAAGQRIREALTYAQNEYTLAYEQEMVNGRLEGRLGWRRQARGFNHHFNERDGTRETWSLAVKIRPFRGSPVKLGFGYGSGTLRTRGDLASSPIADDDISYRHHTLIFETEIAWQTRRRGRLELDLQRERRRFTTDNPFDTSHSGRNDERRDYRARIVQHLRPSLALVAELRRRSNNATFPAGFTTSDEVTDFVENRVTLGLAWNPR